LRVQQFAGQLRVQVAARVDRFDELGARQHRAIRGGASGLCPALQRRQLRGAGLQVRAFDGERCQRLAMLLQPIAVDSPQRGGGSVGAPKLAQAVDVEEEAPVARAPHLVEPHHSRFRVGALLLGAARQLRAPCGRGGELLLDLGGVALDLRDFLDPDGAFDFQLA
jgi:hypothetical protein